MLSAARPLAPRRSSAAFIALPTRSIRSFATTTTTTTNETVTSDTSEQTSKQNGSIHHEPPTAPVPAGIAPLPHRTIVCVSGEMAAPFLNGLATNKVPSWLNQVDKGMQGLYTGILNAQGRVMFDCFMYPTTVLNKDGERVRAMYIEVDKHIGTKLMFNLKRYKLRTRVNLEYARDRGVFAAWGPGFGEQKDGNVTQTHLPKPGELITFNDPRIPGFGTRYVQLQSIEALKSLPRVSTDHYHIRRYLAGLPEGPQEVLCDDSLPLECNMDLMRGIDFQKGCYVGQELTIRTKHTGVVRKRVLPVRLYNLDANNLAAAKVPSKLELAAKAVRQYRRQNRAVGTFLNGIGNIGLALCRLDALTDVRVPGWEQKQSELGRSYAPNEKFGIRWKKSDNDSETEEAAAGIKAFVPAWHRERMEEEESARAEERRRRRAAVEAGRRLVEQG
ncbi:transcription factor, component of CCR4 transcriptional complex, partial [Phyllosticta citricarpa]